MKLASLKGRARRPAGRRRAPISPARSRCREIAPTLQAALDDWAALEPALREVAGRLERRRDRGVQPFDPAACAAPLPRAYQFADGSAYLNHVALVRQARGAELPAELPATIR